MKLKMPIYTFSWRDPAHNIRTVVYQQMEKAEEFAQIVSKVAKVKEHIIEIELPDVVSWAIERGMDELTGEEKELKERNVQLEEFLARCTPYK